MKKKSSQLKVCRKSAPSGNRTRVTSMATIYSTTRPIALFEFVHFRLHNAPNSIKSECNGGEMLVSSPSAYCIESSDPTESLLV